MVQLQQEEDEREEEEHSAPHQIHNGLICRNATEISDRTYLQNQLALYENLRNEQRREAHFKGSFQVGPHRQEATNRSPLDSSDSNRHSSPLLGFSGTGSPDWWRVSSHRLYCC